MKKKPQRKKRRSPSREEGLVMVVVMMVLLMVTATATFAAYSTSMDIRAAGHTRIAMQTRNLATTALLGMIDRTEDQTARALLATIERNNNQNNVRLDLTGLEPPLYPGKLGLRVGSGQIGTGVADPAPANSFGARDPRVPTSSVDVYDDHNCQRLVAGHRADGLSAFTFKCFTFTARATAEISTGGTSYVTQLQTSSAARAHVVFGPE